MKIGDLVMDVCSYLDIEGTENLEGRLGVVIEIIEVNLETINGKFDPGAVNIVEVLMEDGTLEEFEITELELINEAR